MSHKPRWCKRLRFVIGRAHRSMTYRKERWTLLRGTKAWMVPK